MTITRGLGVAAVCVGLAFGFTSTALADGPAPGFAEPGQAPPPYVPPGSAWAVIVAVDGATGSAGWAKAATLVEAVDQARSNCATRTSLYDCGLLVKAPYPGCVARVTNSPPNLKSFVGVGPTADAAYADAVRRVYPASPEPGQSVAFCTTDPEVPRTFNR